MGFIVPDPIPPRPAVPLASDLGALAFAALPEVVRDSDDGTVALVLDAVGAVVQKSVDVLTAPQSWLDPATCPREELPRLAAMAGIDIDGIPESALRGWLADPANYYRGNPDTIRRRVGLTLTGGKSVLLACPYLGDPWRIYVGTLAAETPDSTATLAAIRAEVPAWLRTTAETDLTGKTYAALAATYPTYAAMTATGKTYQELSQESA